MKHRIAVAVLGVVTALSSTSVLSLATPPPRFGDWVPVPGPGGAGLRICANASSCASSAVSITIASITEFHGDDRTNNSVRQLGDLNLTFSDAFATEYGDSAVALGRRASVAMPVNSNRSTYALPATANDPVLTLSVSQLVEGRLALFNEVFNVSVETTSVQVELTVSDWPFEDWNRSLELELAIMVPGGATLPLPQFTDVTVDVVRANTSNSVQYDFPRVSVDTSGNATPAFIGVYKLQDAYRVTLRFFPSSLVKYTFLMSPTSPAVPKPPRPTPSAPSTKLNPLPGGFEFCTTSSCSIRDGSFTLMLGQLGNGTRVNPDASAGIETVLTTFSDTARGLTFVEQAASADGNRITSLFLSVPMLGGHAVPSATNHSDSDAIAMTVTLEHLATASNISWNSRGMEVPVGGAKLSINVGFSDAYNAAYKYQNLVLTLFVSAFERGQLVQNVTGVPTQDGGAMRILLGTSMHLDLPTLAYVDARTLELPTLIETKVHTSGAYEGLIQLTLTLAPFTTTLAYTLGISSDALDRGTTANTTAVASANMTTTVVSGFEGVTTKLLTLSHGEFGLCLAASSCDSASVKMGFSGLGTVGSSALSRFARAPAFDFQDPVLVSEIVKGVNVTKWTTGFRAFVPQSQLRPPIPFDAALATAGSSLPQFIVQVDQYLTAGSSENGDQHLYVPTGALKFSFNLTRWVFASASDELVLNITLANATGTGVSGALGFIETKDTVAGLSRTVVNVSHAVATVAEFPLFAVVDGVTKPVVITASFDASVGVVVTMRFPSFAHSLYYDPVLSSTAQAVDDKWASTTNLRTRRSRSAKMDRTAMALLAALAFVLVLSAMRCVKRVSIKLDLSKVIP